jgi:hypothetical protein
VEHPERVGAGFVGDDGDRVERARRVSVGQPLYLRDISSAAVSCGVFHALAVKQRRQSVQNTAEARRQVRAAAELSRT